MGIHYDSLYVLKMIANTHLGTLRLLKFNRIIPRHGDFTLILSLYTVKATH